MGYRPAMAITTASLWGAILGRLGLPPDASIDTVHRAIGGVVGRGTVQRIREGTTSTGLGIVERIAAQIGCDASDLLADAYTPSHVASEEMPAYSRRPAAERVMLDRKGHMQAHGLSYKADTVPFLTKEELMSGKDLPNAFKIELPDDALGAKAPKGTKATFERREAHWGDAVLLLDANNRPHVRVYRQSLDHEWEGYAANSDFATFNGSMSGVRVVAVLESLGGGWAQLSR